MRESEEQDKLDPQREFFVAEFANVPYRDQRDTMERPFFSLAKNARFETIKYQVGDKWVEVSASAKFGIATIWDADILIWAATQLREAIDRGQPISPELKFTAHQLLKGIGRDTGGKNYRDLHAALDRLAGTLVRTNIRSGNKPKGQGAFHLLEAWTGLKEEPAGSPLGITITLPTWFYEGILDPKGVLTIHEDYFQITGGLERWLYRVARKHAGHQDTGWAFTMAQLYEKSASPMRLSDFAARIRRIVERDELPEYTLEIHRNDEQEEIINFTPREALALDDKRRRNPRRRLLRGLYSSPLKLPEK